MDAPSSVRRLRSLTGLRATVLNGDKVLTSTLPATDPKTLPTGDGAQLVVGGTEYRVQNFVDKGAFGGQDVRVFTLGDISAVQRSTTPDAVRRWCPGRLLPASDHVRDARVAHAAAADRGLPRRRPPHDRRRLLRQGPDGRARRVRRARRGVQQDVARARAAPGRADPERGRVRTRSPLGQAVAQPRRDALLDLVLRTRSTASGADAGRAWCARTATGRCRNARASATSTSLRARSPRSRPTRCARQRARGDRRRGDAIAHPLRAPTGATSLRRRLLGRTGRAFTPTTVSCSPTSRARPRARWRTSSCTRPPTRESVTDELTGLANRRALDEVLTIEVERARRSAAISGSSDATSTTQERQRHLRALQGDVVLRERARVLRSSSREIDQPARYGGEEPAVVLPGTDLEGAYNRAERIREEIERLRIARLDGGGKLSITTSSASPRCARGSAAERSSRPPTTRCTRQSTAERTRPCERGRLRHRWDCWTTPSKSISSSIGGEAPSR